MLFKNKTKNPGFFEIKSIAAEIFKGGGKKKENKKKRKANRNREFYKHKRLNPCKSKERDSSRT